MERLLKQRYYRGSESSWADVVERVVQNVCSYGTKKRIRELMLDRIFMPNSPCLFNAGGNQGLMACFTVGPDEDTLENHVEVLGDISAVAKAGGGCGFTGTNIRPKDAPVAGSAHGYAYGPNAWAVQVSNYLGMITQTGRRQMALMYSMRSDHPDLDEFIDLKQVDDEKFAHNFNQSVMATNQWMREAISDPNSIPGKQFSKVVYSAWNNGEPGLLFYDEINTNSPYRECPCPPIETTNPCGEQPLPPYGSCNLGSINIAHDKFYGEDGEFLYDVLQLVTGYSIRFLDDVGERNRFPNKKFENWYKKHRPIGLGIMGYADALLRMGIAYGSKDAQAFLGKTLSAMRHAANSESSRLGTERGVPEHCEKAGLMRRNITLLSIAPTGSIALLAGCSHGIEPIFSPVFNREDEKGEIYLFEHPDRNSVHFRSAINEDAEKTLTWKEHVDTQATAQKHCWSGVSKTVNMNSDATVQDVRDVMIYAWENNCKGVTVYRNNSRQKQVLTAKDMACPTGICDL